MTPKYRVIYHLAASNDMDDIYSYITFHLKEKGTAKHLIKRLYQDIRALDMFPERHRKVEWEPWSSLDVRQMPVGRYMVYYQVDTSLRIVNILRIFYGGRDIEQIVNGEGIEPSEIK